jgi:hypothetical protein
MSVTPEVASSEQDAEASQQIAAQYLILVGR